MLTLSVSAWGGIVRVDVAPPALRVVTVPPARPIIFDADALSSNLRVGRITVADAVAWAPPTRAVMVAPPNAMPVTWPAADTVTFAASDVDQVTF
jgi:hypothetical protein